MKRTKYSKEFKLQVIKEALYIGNNTTVARRYDLNANMVSRWVREYKDGKFGNIDVSVKPDLVTKQITKENEKLKILLGEKDLEIAILRDMIKKKKTHLVKKWK